MEQPQRPLAANVHAVACGEDLVLLDVAADQYFWLPEAAAGLSIDPGLGLLTGLDDELAAELEAAGLLARQRISGVRACSPAPRESALDLVAPDWPARPILGAILAASFDMTWRFRGRSFAQLIDQVARRQGGRHDIDGATRAGQVFDMLLPWTPVQGACLYQSFLLLDVLGRLGLSAQWVFGVRTWPFRAHCWVQAGDIVLNDTVDHASSFDPILVV